MLKRPEFQASLSIAAIPVAVVLSIAVGMIDSEAVQTVWFAVANWFVALGALFVAATIAPYFEVETDTKFAGAAFFVATALVHVDLALLAMLDPHGVVRSDLRSWHMMILHAVQALTLWGFILGLSEAAIVNRARLRALEGRPEVGRRAADPPATPEEGEGDG